MLLCIRPLTFLTEPLCLSSSPSVVSTALVFFGRHLHVNKTTPIHFINGRCHIKQLKPVKAVKLAYNQSQKVCITPLVINALGNGHTNTHNYTEPKQFQETRCVRACGPCTNLSATYVFDFISDFKSLKSEKFRTDFKISCT